MPLAITYKQLDAPFGQFARDTLIASTWALGSYDPSDATYSSIESQIESLTNQRKALAARMITLLNGAEFNGQPISPAQATVLIKPTSWQLHHKEAVRNMDPNC